MKEIQATEYISTKIVCKTLKIQPSTLRKYASMLDDKSKNEFYFTRDEANNRIYTKEDIATLQLLIQLKNKPSYTLDTAVSEIVGLSYTSDTDTAIARDTDKNEFLSALRSLVAQQNKYLENYQDALQKKDEQIDRLENLVEVLVRDSNKSKQSKQIQGEKIINNSSSEKVPTNEKQEQPRKWWQFWI